MSRDNLIPSNLWSRFESEVTDPGSRTDEQRSPNQYMSSIQRAPIFINSKDKSPSASPQARSSPPVSNPSPTHQPFSMESLIHASEAAAQALTPQQKSSGPDGSSAIFNRSHEAQTPTHQWIGGTHLQGGGGGGSGPSASQRFNVFDMKSLAAALASVEAGRGDVRRVLKAANQGNFRPRLPGLTKLVSQLTREGNWQKGLEVFESLDAIEGLIPDTTITNAAISACDKGGQWNKALEIFNAMDSWKMPRDTITYSALISALAKGRNWELSIDVFNHMIESGIETDAVTCCSLITSLDKGGQWQMAEKVFIQMYQDNPELLPLLVCIEDEQTIESAASLPSSPMLTPSSSPQQSHSLLSSPVQTQRLAVEVINSFMSSPNQSTALGETVDRLSHLYPEGLDKMPENLTRQLCSLLSDTPGEMIVFREPSRSSPSPQGSASLLSPLTPPSTPPMTSHLEPGGQRSLLRASSLNAKKAAPNRVCCNALLAAYSRAAPPQYRKAVRLLESMWSIGGELVPDLVSYNTAIKAAGNARQIGLAFKVWKVMQSRGCESSQATFGTLISIAADVGDTARVREAWAGLRTSGHEIHISSANAQVAACFAPNGNWAEGQRLFRDILSGSLGVKANAATFGIVMKGCLDHDLSDKIQALFHQMRELAIAPTSLIYGYMIEAYALCSQFKDCLEILARIFHDASTRPPLSTFTALFKAIASTARAVKGNPTSINELRVTASNVRSFLRKVMQPQAQHFGSPGGSGRHQVQPLPPDSVLFNAMVEAYSALNDTESCIEMYNIASSLGLTLDEESVVRVLCPLCDLHLWSKVVDVVRGLHSGGGPGMTLDLLVCLLKRMNEEKAFCAAYATMRMWMTAQVLAAMPPPPPPPPPRAMNAALSAPRDQVASAADPLRDLKNAPSTLLLSERLKSEGLVDLLLMCFIIDKEAMGEWEEAVEMWLWIGKMHEDGSGTPFSKSKDVRMILFELMLQSGGVEGLREAVMILIESQQQGIMSSYKLPQNGSPASVQLEGSSSWDIVVLLAFLLELSRLAKQGVCITQPQLLVSLKREQSDSISLGKGSNDGRSSLVLVLGCKFRSVLKQESWTKEQREAFPLFKPVLMLNDANDHGKVLVDVRSLYSGLGF